jgi:hypothetical protein
MRRYGCGLFRVRETMRRRGNLTLEEPDVEG